VFPVPPVVPTERGFEFPPLVFDVMFPTVVTHHSVVSADSWESAGFVTPLTGDTSVSGFRFGGHYCLLPSVEMSGYGLGHFQLRRRFEELYLSKALGRNSQPR